ncbi:hypothetical protein Baya_3019 [Bagarius yarrelli]|uniref:Uncharacterized protein n=1 Tax=Bagarius yarrelli TaxID=175774 RepID=A0A556TU74_BAGYA|nr:hypothetical protein Baya_3019 [Bagarius yarrelli]
MQQKVDLKTDTVNGTSGECRSEGDDEWDQETGSGKHTIFMAGLRPLPKNSGTSAPQLLWIPQKHLGARQEAESHQLPSNKTGSSFSPF